MYNARFCGGLLLWVSFSAWVFSGESAPPPEEQRAASLGEVQIVASPLVEGIQTDRYGNEATTVTDQQMEGLGARDLASALRTAPGVTITRYNVVGSFGGGEGGAVMLRGFGSSRPGAEIQTTIDGVPVGNAIWSHPLLDMVPVGPAEAFEIRKSAQPLLFGNAFGVVNLLPKRRRKEGFTTALTLSAGSFDTFMESFEHGGKKGAFHYMVTGSYRRSDGHRDDADGYLGDCSLRLPAPQRHVCRCSGKEVECPKHRQGEFFLPL